MKNKVIAVAALLLVLVLAGCGSSRVHFVGPAGSKLFLSHPEKEYTMPIVLELKQNESPKKLPVDAGGQSIRIVLPDGTRLKGYLHVYSISMDQVERLAEVPFSLSEEQIIQLKAGTAVTVIGFTGGRNQPVYKINLGVERE